MRLTAFLPLFLLGCSGFSLTDEPAESDPDANDALPKDVGVFITESSASLDVAAIEAIQPSTHRRTEITGVGLDTDVQLRRLRGPDGKLHIFTVQSTQGAVVERDREGRAIGRWDVFEQGKTASQANPLDVAFDEDENLWVTRHGATSLIVFAKESKSVLGTVDLSAYADDDGVPDMSAIAILGRTAYVALRRLEDGFGTTKNTSTVVAIDTRTFAVRPFVELPAKDPGAEFRLHDGALFISCIGGPLLREPDRNAALVRIDLAAEKATKLIDASAAGGFVTAFDFAGENGYAIIASFADENPTKVVRFDVATGEMEEPWASTSTYRFWDIAAVRGTHLLVSDRDPQAPGIRVLSLGPEDRGAILGKIRTRLLPNEVLPLFPPES